MAAPHHLPKEEDFNTHFIEEETEAQGGLVLWVPFGSPSGCLFVALHARPPPHKSSLVHEWHFCLPKGPSRVPPPLPTQLRFLKAR